MPQAQLLSSAVSPKSGPAASPSARSQVLAQAFDGAASRKAADQAPAVGAGTKFGRSAPSALKPAGSSEFPGELMGTDGVESVPGSIFGWKPFNEAPGHGFWPIDALARWYFGSEDRRFSRGYEDRGAARREDAKVFFYGERHTDKGLIAKNMALLAKDMSRGKGAIVLVEGYVGADLHGSRAIRFLETRGLDTDLLDPEMRLSDVQVRGWDESQNYSETSSPSLRHHMELLSLNMLMHGERRGPGYYADLFKQAARTLSLWREMRRAVIGGRNKDLDRSLAQAVSAAKSSGATVHVIAGAEHLVDRPLLVDVPLLGSSRLRKGLRDLLSGAPYWSSMPADTPDPAPR